MTIDLATARERDDRKNLSYITICNDDLLLEQKRGIVRQLHAMLTDTSTMSGNIQTLLALILMRMSQQLTKMSLTN